MGISSQEGYMPDKMSKNSCLCRENANGNGNGNGEHIHETTYNYKECLKNHAGGHGRECHRWLPRVHAHLPTRHTRSPQVLRLQLPPQLPQERDTRHPGFPRTAAHQMIVPYKMGLACHSSLEVGKKRLRTKFNREHKEKMLSFAEKPGWKIQKLEEGVVHNFCQQIVKSVSTSTNNTMSGSGTPNKRLHEEGGGGHNLGSSKYPHDDSVPGYPNVGPKLAPPPPLVAANDYHHHAQPFDYMKISRNESTDRRSPLLPMYHHRVVLSSSSDSHSDHPVASENRSELRDSKDNTRYLKGENQSGKESRGDDNKEAKSDRDRDAYHPEYNFDGVKTEKDGNNQLNWKESKEQFRGKRYPDAPGGNADPWRANVHGPVEREGVKEGSATEDRDYFEAHEAVGEDKVDLKGEDRFKDKDRKRKELKHRDWGERDKDKNERRNNLQLGSSSGEGKESTREEREAERWERERKDLSKDKEKLKEREKDHFKREAWSGAEKDVLHNEKEAMDVSARTPEFENLTLEQKKQKEHDGWKNIDREARERRKERDADVEGERPEKRSRCYNKDSDDGCADTEGGPEKEREALNYGVQQRKRMLRPRGSPQVANREPCFRSHAQDNEGYIFQYFFVTG
ncbi:zinc finger CCCH domain protein [Actinidia rufa]|uniref:Zinc finger CCCH domain protein n=1 Tax=Actinidia rufa TaxID=165716 RepID=A0A7J0EIY1_9ERIC|nr:zinc finger CCCH domain protein [Actinidia rufa]